MGRVSYYLIMESQIFRVLIFGNISNHYLSGVNILHYSQIIHLGKVSDLLNLREEFPLFDHVHFVANCRFSTFSRRSSSRYWYSTYNLYWESSLLSNYLNSCELYFTPWICLFMGDKKELSKRMIEILVKTSSYKNSY